MANSLHLGEFLRVQEPRKSEHKTLLRSRVDEKLLSIMFLRPKWKKLAYWDRVHVRDKASPPARPCLIYWGNINLKYFYSFPLPCSALTLFRQYFLSRLNIENISVSTKSGSINFTIQLQSGNFHWISCFCFIICNKNNFQYWASLPLCTITHWTAKFNSILSTKFPSKNYLDLVITVNCYLIIVTYWRCWRNWEMFRNKIHFTLVGP